MANAFKLNQGGGNNQSQHQDNNTSQFKFGNTGQNAPAPEPTPEPVVEREQPQVPQFDLGSPSEDIVETIKNTPEPQPTYNPVYHEEQTELDEDDEEDIPKRGRKNDKRNKRKSVKDKKNKKKKDDEPLDADKAYSKFRTKKIVVYICFIIAIIALLFFGVYNTFFKHTLTAKEAAVYTNRYNNQTIVQQWDTGVEGYLQANLYTLMKSKYDVSNSVDKDFKVSNIAVEKNQQITGDMLITFFSADVTIKDETNRVFCTLPLSVKDGTFNLAGELQFCTWEPYSADVVTVVENPTLDFNDDTRNKEASEALKPTISNFFELGYNLKQDISDIYKGDHKLEFKGKFIELKSCSVYDEPNEMGYNAEVSYIVQLDNGAGYLNHCYMQIEKNSSGSYIIKGIL